MSLNPGEDWQKRVLSECFNGGSPYIDMYRCGFHGVPIEQCLAKCYRNGIAIRTKDIKNYNNGAFVCNTGKAVKADYTSVGNVTIGIPFDRMKLEDFPIFPIGWNGSDKRFFPCLPNNVPMQSWGWKKKEDGTIFQPELYTWVDAKALSPVGWIGQNMLYQRFIVMDIDGRGHGEEDLEVIEFGLRYKDKTLSFEDPEKQGSFHLYFKTNRLIPVKHFTWAKLDLMGNASNAAVYFKNKKSNGLPMMELDETIWQDMMEYQRGRKEHVVKS